MGQAELISHQDILLIHSILFFYGDAAGEELSRQIAIDIQQHWNYGDPVAIINNRKYKVRFHIEGYYRNDLTEIEVLGNTDPKNNYFRIEASSPLEVSFVDGVGSNTGFFLLKNLLQDSTTAAHEYGHTLGLDHPHHLDIRGRGVPGIMYPRGTIVDAVHQYNPQAVPGDNFNGGTMNPISRKVLQQDIDNLDLGRLRFDRNNFAIVGGFSSLWHDAW